MHHGVANRGTPETPWRASIFLFRPEDRWKGIVDFREPVPPARTPERAGNGVQHPRWRRKSTGSSMSSAPHAETVDKRALMRAPEVEHNSVRQATDKANDLRPRAGVDRDLAGKNFDSYTYEETSLALSDVGARGESLPRTTRKCSSFETAVVGEDLPSPAMSDTRRGTSAAYVFGGTSFSAVASAPTTSAVQGVVLRGHQYHVGDRRRLLKESNGRAGTNSQPFAEITEKLESRKVENVLTALLDDLRQVRITRLQLTDPNF